MFHKSRRLSLRERNSSRLEFLRHLLELVTLDDVAHLVLAKISELDAAFKPGPNFLHVILETAQGRHSAIVDWLAAAQDACSPGTRDAPVGHETTGHDAFAQLENLFHFGVPNDSFAMLRLEQPRHRVLELID